MRGRTGNLPYIRSFDSSQNPPQRDEPEERLCGRLRSREGEHEKEKETFVVMSVRPPQNVT